MTTEIPTWFGVDWIDWAVIAGYLVLVTVVGVWTVRRVKSTASYFISDRKFGKVMLMFFTFGAGTHSDQAVMVGDKIREDINGPAKLGIKAVFKRGIVNKTKKVPTNIPIINNIAELPGILSKKLV